MSVGRYQLRFGTDQIAGYCSGLHLLTRTLPNRPTIRSREGHVPARKRRHLNYHASEVHMNRVAGIGGIFFNAPALKAWYKRHLGIDVHEWGATVFT
jgi:hypothetical protein